MHDYNDDDDTTSPKDRFFHFGQNNSGGGYAYDEVVAVSVVFEASSPEEANAFAKEKGVFDYSYCECCGPRFYEKWSHDDGYASVEEAFNRNTFYKGKSFVVHYKDGTVKHHPTTRAE
jgi:hypothetical protein